MRTPLLISFALLAGVAASMPAEARSAIATPAELDAHPEGPRPTEQAARRSPQPAKAVAPERESANGRYRGLVTRFACPADEASYGEFTDWGFWRGGEYCGQLRPAGHYVWYRGEWHVWADIVLSRVVDEAMAHDTCRSLSIGDPYYPKYSLCCDLGDSRSLWALRAGKVSHDDGNCAAAGIR